MRFWQRLSSFASSLARRIALAWPRSLTIGLSAPLWELWVISRSDFPRRLAVLLRQRVEQRHSEVAPYRSECGQFEHLARLRVMRGIDRHRLYPLNPVAKIYRN